MAEDGLKRLHNIKYALEEIQEMVQCAKDLRQDFELFKKDHEAIKEAKDLQKIRLYKDYFNF